MGTELKESFVSFFNERKLSILNANGKQPVERVRVVEDTDERGDN